MEPLKPCPFCGGDANIVCRSVGTTGSGIFLETYEAICLGCGAAAGGHFRSEFTRVNGEFVFLQDGFSAAVEAWNRRAGDA